MLLRKASLRRLQGRFTSYYDVIDACAYFLIRYCFLESLLSDRLNSLLLHPEFHAVQRSFMIYNGLIALSTVLGRKDAYQFQLVS